MHSTSGYPVGKTKMTWMRTTGTFRMDYEYEIEGHLAALTRSHWIGDHP